MTKYNAICYVLYTNYAVHQKTGKQPLVGLFAGDIQGGKNMPLIDNVHQGNVRFTHKDFTLLNFSFTGSIYKDSALLGNNVNIEAS
ncbi:hypothetical protein AGMMS49944_18630 [Spirochaetia bacterium]|nr:hypothetical protein AGMMS49944_18630 [Spirochaetia bacterium]